MLGGESELGLVVEIGFGIALADRARSAIVVEGSTQFMTPRTLVISSAFIRPASSTDNACGCDKVKTIVSFCQFLSVYGFLRFSLSATKGII